MGAPTEVPWGTVVRGVGVKHILVLLFILHVFAVSSFWRGHYTLDSLTRLESDRPVERRSLRFPGVIPINAQPEKYVSFLVCKGYCNQLMSFADGIALCYLLNVTCVLPKWYRNFNYFEAASQTPTPLANSDPQAHYSVDMDYFYDVQYFIERMSGFVKIVPELPVWLQGETEGSFDDLWSVDSAKPHTLMPYEQLLQRKNTLRLRCPLHLVTWNTEDVGALRTAIHSALLPSKPLQAAFDSRLAAFATATGDPMYSSQPLPYLAVHVRDESDWRKYCVEEAENPKLTQIETFEVCYKTLDEVAKLLVEWNLHSTYKHIYVATGNLTTDKARTLMEAGGFKTVASQSTICSQEMGDVRCSHSSVDPSSREFRAAVDLMMVMHSSFFVGNVFSSFSWTARLVRLMRRSSIFTPTDTLYYNMDIIYTTSDLQKEEAIRFAVSPGIVHPSWHSEQLSSYYWTHLMHVKGECLHKHNVNAQCVGGAYAPPQVEEIKITDSGSTDSGYIFFKGWVQPGPSGLDWHPRLLLLVNGKPRMHVTATIEDDVDSSVRLGQVGFDAEAPIYAEDYGSNMTAEWHGARISVCTTVIPHVCSIEVITRLDIPLRRYDENTRGVVWIWMPGRYRSGGPEALHQLHQEINKWHAAGEIAIHSIFPDGDDFYWGPYSNFSPKMRYSYPGPKDYLVVPEHHSVPVPAEYQYVMKEVGMQGLIWHVGQHVTRLEISVKGKESFKPICLSPYFARLLECPEKAIINVPMAEVFLEMGRQEDAHPTPKENIVVFDSDDTAWFDPNKLKLQEGVKLVLLKGFNRTEVLDLMHKAKVYLDTYLTGNERAVFESTLLNAIPIISNHGPATSWHDFPLHKRYKWQYHDYKQLSEIIRFAINHYDEALREVRPFKDYIYRMPALMSENVRTYYQDDVHVVIPLLPEKHKTLSNTERYAAFAAVLFAVIQYPFSTQELVVDNSFYAEFDSAGILYHLYSVGLIDSFTSTQALAEFKRFGPKAVYFQRPLAKHARDYTLIIPPSLLTIHPNLAASMFKAAYGSDYVAVFGPDNIVLADWSKYYDLVNTNLWYFDDDFTTTDIQRLLTELNSPFLVLDGIGEIPEEQRLAIPWLKKHRCKVATIPIFGNPSLSPCLCQDLRNIMSHALWSANVNKIPDGDEFRLWLESLKVKCRPLT